MFIVCNTVHVSIFPAWDVVCFVRFLMTKVYWLCVQHSSWSLFLYFRHVMLVMLFCLFSPERCYWLCAASCPFSLFPEWGVNCFVCYLATIIYCFRTLYVLCHKSICLFCLFLPHGWRCCLHNNLVFLKWLLLHFHWQEECLIYLPPHGRCLLCEFLRILLLYSSEVFRHEMVLVLSGVIVGI